MYLHIQFSNGANPFVKYGKKADLMKELRKWKRDTAFSFGITKETEDGIEVLATAKTMGDCFHFEEEEVEENGEERV